MINRDKKIVAVLIVAALVLFIGSNTVLALPMVDNMEDVSDWTAVSADFVTIG